MIESNQHAIAILRRMQEPDAYEPQITAAAFEALDMAIKALERASFPQRHENDLISRQFMYSLGATCLAKRNDDGELVAVTGIRYLPSAQPETAVDILQEEVAGKEQKVFCYSFGRI